MTKGLILDGWNLFSYEGITNDMEYKKILAVKQLGDYCAEVFLDLKTMSFELVNYLQSKDCKLSVHFRKLYFLLHWMLH